MLRKDLSSRNRKDWKDPIRRKELIEKISKTKFGGRTRLTIYKEVVKLAGKGLTSKQIADNLDISYPSCRNLARAYNDTELLNTLTRNCKKAQSVGGKKKKGKKSPLKGKTYEEIFGDKEKAKARKKVTSSWMKTSKNIRRFCTKPSKPQIALFKKIKKKYTNYLVELEYPVVINKTKTIWLDIAVPELKLNYELDGAYWHQDKDKDDKRDQLLINLGWKIERTIYTK